MKELFLQFWLKNTTNYLINFFLALECFNSRITYPYYEIQTWYNLIALLFVRKVACLYYNYCNYSQTLYISLSLPKLKNPGSFKHANPIYLWRNQGLICLASGKYYKIFNKWDLVYIKTTFASSPVCLSLGSKGNGCPCWKTISLRHFFYVYMWHMQVAG